MSAPATPWRAFAGSINLIQSELLRSGNIAFPFPSYSIPFKNTFNILSECKRILKQGGTLAIVDLDPDKLKKYLRNPFRKWAFDATEPHITEFYDTYLLDIMSDMFDYYERRDLGPLNSIYLAS